MSLAKPLSVILVGTIPGARPPTCDPALDLAAEGAAQALTRYARERSDDARAALPIKAGATPSLFTVLPLTMAGWRFVDTAPTDVERVQRAFMVACHGYTDERGAEHTAQTHGGITESGARGFAMASEEWLQHVADSYGTAAIEEVAAIAVQRAKAGPRALAPFDLPRGLMLAR